MTRVLEIVLDVVRAAPPAAPAAHADRSAGSTASCASSTAPRSAVSPDASASRGSAPGAFAAIVSAALPQLCALDATDATDAGASMRRVMFDRGGALARGGWRLAVETRGAAHGVVVSRRRTFTPGLCIVEPIFDAPLEAEDIESALFDAAPAPFREALAAAGAPEPVAALAGERHAWRWTREGVSTEVVLDADVRDALAPSREAEERNALHELHELHELRVSVAWDEGADAAPLVDALFACAHDIVDVLPAFVRVTDALERAAAGCAAGDVAAVHADPVDLRGAATAEAALLAIGANISAQWFGNDAGVRDSPNTEFIHQMRVSQRRLRTAMRIFSRWRDAVWNTHIAPELKWLGGLLGEARDRDVFVESTLPALAGADTEPARWNELRDAAEAQRAAARARVREALASPRYAHAALAWLQWLAALARRSGASNEDGRSLYRHARKRVRRYYERLAQTQKLTAIDEASRHRVRIAAKYLRYTLEFFTSITSRRTRTQTARTLSRLQSVLGDGNDAAVALRYLERMDAEPYQLGFARGWCEAVKRYTAKEGERLLRELPPPKVSRGA
ncbi:CHAD domain-containing protein [Paraburkholderia tropica]|uniref:CHAD domain-containing protein n=1 Tax=Paraburkholderia tropica TaxID=92647 RepID=UPI003D284D0C